MLNVTYFKNSQLKKGLKVFIALLIFQSVAFPQKLKADLVIIKAKIHTINKKRPKAKAVAIKGNKIIAVGKNKKIRRLIGAKTKIIDAKGKLVLPGFNDSHTHFLGIGNRFLSVNLKDAKKPSDVAEKLKFYTEFLPKGSWILGGNWNHENWTPNDLPTQELIDSVTPEHPVFLYHSSAKIALANSLALKIANVHKDRKSLKGGEIVKNKNGEPTGVLKNTAMLFVRVHIPKSIKTRRLEAIEAGSKYAASLGVTSVQDMDTDDNLEIYRELEKQGKLRTRVYDCLPLANWQKLQKSGIKRATGNALVRSGCLKGFSDGNYTKMPKLYEQVRDADRADLQIMLHGIGGNPNDIILSVFERVAKENGEKDRRFRVEHAYGFRSKDLERFGHPNVIASLQPHLFGGGDPYRNLLNSNAKIAFGSDASITDFNPLYGIYAAVKSRGLSQNQKLSVEEAIYLYTMGSAYAEFQENVKGSIEVGKLADLIILSDDIFTIKPEKVRQTKILTTILDGKVVYEYK